MNKCQIDQLLEKYWNVETTLEEENTLKEYFTSGLVDASHSQYKDLFQYFKTESDVISSQVLELTNALVEENDAQVIRFNPRSLVKYAAALVFLFAAYALIMQALPNDKEDSLYAGKFTSLDEEQEAQEAYEITMEALSYLSTKINTTETEIQESLAPVQKAIKVIY